MCKKQLPVKQPPAYGYQFYSYPLAILANYEETKPWVYSNFIQLAFDRDFLTSPVPYCFYLFDYAINPWLTVHRLSRDVFALTRNNINEFVVECLKNYYYVYLNVDEFYIPSRLSYESRHFSHDLMVFGYDSEAGEFDILGFDNKYLYAPSKVSFALFEKAYRSLDEITNYCHQFYLYKFKPEGAYRFNLKLVIETLEDYLYGRNTSERFGMLREPWDRAYGMDAYPYIKQHFDMYKDDNKHFDIRYFHIILEHKSLMAARVEYMEKTGLLGKMDNYGEAWRHLEKKAVLLRNLLLKHVMNHDPELIGPMSSLLDDIEMNERALLPDLIASLRKKLAE